jgi:Cd2+/Zn2+-exporting ATPase
MKSQGHFVTDSLHVEGMDCPDELPLVQKQLQCLPGVEQWEPNFVTRTLRVTFDPRRIDLAAIRAALGEVGLAARHANETPPRPSEWPNRIRVASIVGSGLLLGAAAAARVAGATHWGVLLAAIALAAWPVLLAALRSLARGTLDTNVLVTIATAGALAIGDWFEAGTVMFLFTLAQWLERLSLGRARRAVDSLRDLAPQQATVWADNVWTTRVVDAVQVGDRLLVRPGERVPVDGLVDAGAGAVNQAPVTGESMPVAKQPGSTVYGGSLNLEGALEVRATRPAGDSLVARVARMVHDAQFQRAPSERLVDQFARVYTPIVIALALAVAVLPPLLGPWMTESVSGHWPDWIYRGLVLLVVSCPCALVISTPVSVLCGLYRAARLGVLLRGGAHLEEAGQTRVVVFDKTGTLTLGSPAVAGVQSFGSHTADEVLRLAGSVEHHSQHPFARALTDSVTARGLVLEPVTDFISLTGQGARGTIGGQPITVANPRFFDPSGTLADRIARELDSRQATGATPVAVGTAEGPIGFVWLQDQVRAGAGEAIARLRRLGIVHVVILTGDSAPAAALLAGRLGIDTYFAELLPEAKVEQVRQLVQQYRHVLMLGDGVNDAPALASATVGLAMGASGSDTALAAAHGALMADDLARVPDLIALGRRTRRVIAQNVAVSLAGKLAFVLAAAAGWATLWMAVAADMGTSLLVVFNGMRLSREGVERLK